MSDTRRKIPIILNFERSRPIGYVVLDDEYTRRCDYVLAIGHRGNEVLEYGLIPDSNYCAYLESERAAQPGVACWVTNVLFSGRHVKVACDRNCDKAWGINTRPKETLSADPDDYVFLADEELGIAPENPGTSEGGEFAL